MNWNLAALAYICATLIVGGQWLWKTGLSVDASEGSFLSPAYLLRVFTSPWILSGVFLYVVATLFFMYLLREYRLGIVYPVVISMVLINSVIVSKVFLAETFTVQNALGLVLLLGAVFLLSGN
jgi:multidrug transporter EmrE-like cation transporter